MKSYRYELIVYKKEYSEEFKCEAGRKIKRFLGNDTNELIERFELWNIKQGHDMAEIIVYTGEIQHAGYVYKGNTGTEVKKW